jgi:hypothetical protein
MDFWEMIKKDIQKSVKEGIVKVREGVTVAKAKAEELTKEGKRRIRILELKTKVQREISELGGRVYTISQKSKYLSSDKKVQSIITRIKKLEEKILKLEGRHVKKSEPKRASRTRKA